MSIAAAVQMTSTDDVDHNLAIAAHHIEEAANKGAQLVVLPEMFAILSAGQRKQLQHSEPYGNGKIQDFLKTQAEKHKLWIVGGTIPIQAEHSDRARAACLVLDDKGTVTARYDKIHLFDVCLKEGKEAYQESETIEPGTDITIIDTPIGKLGLAVCYDIRFPAIFKLLFEQAIDVLALPTAFTVETGKVHWDPLTRCRAIENQCYLIAACQTGQHSSSRATYGHSRIIDPWGTILAEEKTEPKTLTAEIDLDYLKKIRQKLPIARHQRM